MGSSSIIIEKWWLFLFAGSLPFLLFFISHSRHGYNMTLLQKPPAPRTISTNQSMQSPMSSNHIVDANNEPENSSDQFPQSKIPPCNQLNSTYITQNNPSSGLENSRPLKPATGNMKPAAAATASSSHQIPKPSKIQNDDKPLANKIEKQKRRCNLYEGKWVYDPVEMPLYDSSKCQFFFSGRANCQKNGRPDKEYEKWRWEANDCKIPKFDAKDMLERLRGKRVVIVGDSINYGQWESLACMLYSAIPDQSIVDVRNRVFIAKSYNLIVKSYWAEFLVDVIVNKTSGKKILNLESLSSIAWKWKGADVMVFNTGHWWMSRQRWDWFLYKQKLITEMSLDRAFKLAMRTWAGWIEKNVDKNKTTVFFRGMSPAHSGCYRAETPIRRDEPFKLKGSEVLIKDIVERRIQDMRIPVRYLNITQLTVYRKDAHSSFYWMTTRPRPSADCSHWCLPGVPDTWNHLMYATMVLHS